MNDPDFAAIAEAVGTPFHCFDLRLLHQQLAPLAEIHTGTTIAVRYAVKANSESIVLRTIAAAGLWFDAGSGGEVERLALLGIDGSDGEPRVSLCCDAFRDNAATVAREHGAHIIIGSPQMLHSIAHAMPGAAVGIRVNPGFGHGHVDACDTGGPSSKHGVWHEHVAAVIAAADAAGLSVNTLHAHVGSGPDPVEFLANTNAVCELLAQIACRNPSVHTISIGGGAPYDYSHRASAYSAEQYAADIQRWRELACTVAGRDICLTVEPGRLLVAAAGSLIATVQETKDTGPDGYRFVMVDAGFVDLVRPAMYGSFHNISPVTQIDNALPETPTVVAGVLCESGDVFSRGEQELLRPHMLPPVPDGSLIRIHDTGAYGASMSSNYLSVGRAPLVVWDGMRGVQHTRREVAADLLLRDIEPRVIPSVSR